MSRTSIMLRTAEVIDLQIMLVYFPFLLYLASINICIRFSKAENTNKLLQIGKGSRSNIHVGHFYEI